MKPALGLVLLTVCIVQSSDVVPSSRKLRQASREESNGEELHLETGELPWVQIEAVPSTQVLGSSFSVFCSGSGIPLPMVYWTRRDGSHLPQCARDVAGTLIFTDFSEECDGVYTCWARNKHGTATADLTLTAVEPSPPPSPPPCNFRCGVTEESVCVPTAAICNGSTECPNGADEANCRIVETECQPDELSCGAGECVFRNKLCDGVTDCSDGADEEGCNKPSENHCRGNQFACGSFPSSPCIPLGYRCDGVHQCASLKDERACERPRGFSGPARGPIDVTTGSRVELTCTSAGIPAPFITWRRNCEPLPRDARYSVSSVDGRGRMIINNVTVGDAGIFSCEMVTLFGRERIGSTTEIIVQDPLAYQCEDLEGTPYEQNTKYFLKKTVDNGLGDQDAADIIFVMDESGSMLEEHQWLKAAVVKLDQALRDIKVGNATFPNQFGLVGFSRDSNAHRGGVVIQNLTTPTEFVRSVRKLRLSGVYEDGYNAIAVALQGINPRPNTAKLIVLVTDEDRDVLNFQLDKDAVERMLKRAGFKLTALVQQSYAGVHFGERVTAPVMGIDASFHAYVLDTDAADNYIIAQRGIPLPESGFGTTYSDYVDLAVRTGGSAWDLRMIREGEPVLTAFTNAFVKVEAEGVLSTIEKCFECDCVQPEPDCTESLTDLDRCRGAVNPLPRPPYVCVNPSVVTAEAHTSITFICDIKTLDTSDEIRSIKWEYPDGVNPVIRAGGRTLKVENVTETAIGNYSCMVSTDKGLSVQAQARVDPPAIPKAVDEEDDNMILEVPRVTLSANQVRSRVGDSIVLNCTVPGYPYPHVVWSRVDNQRLPFNVVVQEFREERVWMMTLMVSGPSYFGDYDCSAENFLGKSVQVATIEEI